MKALRMKDVTVKVGLGQSTLYRMIAAGTFPKPFELVPGRTAWLEEDIDAWLAEKAGKKTVAGRPTDTITQLSAQPVA
ncbi:transcriptional regulator [Burkholderia ubonensis]|uniref:helix-turn-helix transcriptional regulator n=1 Tax=Burkholderia ubonensis TaxID=101571 RepID=UPI0008FE4956|nr:AlpA family transcriptional regulator [Burkholderia ubonensis]OJA71098.1 transcriptional regulator [Burkholderia ubonensis]